MLFRRLGALLAALSIAFIPLVSQADTQTVADAPTPGMTGNVIDAQAQADALKDLDPNSWAYQAVVDLANDGIIIGYPDGYFKGQRPMTRYEAAVMVERAIQYVTKKLANPTMPGPEVTQADLDKIRALIDDLRGDIEALKLRVSDLDTRLTAVEATQARAKLGLVYFIRPGTFTEAVSAYGASPFCTTPGCAAALPPGVALTGGNLGAGENITANKYFSGQNTTGYGYQLVRLLLDGTLDSRFSYHLRLENRYFWDTPSAQLSSGSTFGGTAANVPNYLTSTTSTFDYPTNTTIRFNYGYMQYNDPSGVYAAIGRLNETDGTLGMVYADQLNGAKVGFSQFGYKIEGGYAYDWPSNNAAGQNTCGTAGVVCGYATQTIFGQISFTPIKPLLIGASYTDDINDRISNWNPSVCSVTGKAPTYVGGLPVCPVSSANGAPSAPAGNGYLGAYQNQVTNITTLGAFGRWTSAYAGVPYSLEAEGSYRPGINPSTGTTWQSNLAYWFQGKIGNYNPKAFKAYAEGGIIAAGLNSVGPHTSIVNGTSYDGQYQGNPNGYQISYVGLHYWFSNYGRIGLVYNWYDILNGTTYPVASAACPGCFLTHDIGQGLFLQSYLQF